MTVDKTASLLHSQGLIVLGSFAVNADDGVPPVAAHRPAKTLLMIGHGGSSFWATFAQSSEYHDGQSDPLDRWSNRIGQQLADKLDGRVLFPFDGPPYWPFQRWAKRTGQIAPSRISMMMHAHFGLWHAYRFALALPGLPAEPGHQAVFESPCPDCVGQPCMTACPVKAFDGERFNTERCVAHLLSEPGNSCRTNACLARRSCPVGQSFIYDSAHAQFHMDHFVANHTDPGKP